MTAAGVDRSAGVIAALTRELTSFLFIQANYAFPTLAASADQAIEWSATPGRTAVAASDQLVAKYVL